MFGKILCFFFGHKSYSNIWFKTTKQIYFMEFKNKEDKKAPILNVDFCIRCHGVYWKQK